MSTIGKRIAKKRKKLGLTQNDLAEILMISNKAVSKWESDMGNPSFEFLPKLCETLDCSADYLILGECSFENYKKIKNGIGVKLGIDYQDNEYYEDITKFPHLLVLGSTGSGKSCLFHSFIIDIIKTYSPEKVKLGLINPKEVEFDTYQKLPHLMYPIAFTIDNIINLLENAKKEVENRYTLFANKRVKNIEEYNKGTEDKLPYNVIIVDELADIVLNNKKAENILLTLCMIGRGAGFHIIAGTQRLRPDTLSDDWRKISSKICFNVSNVFCLALTFSTLFISWAISSAVIFFNSFVLK